MDKKKEYLVFVTVVVEKRIKARNEAEAVQEAKLDVLARRTIKIEPEDITGVEASEITTIGKGVENEP